ncbi:MAG: class I SAM-dependent rRNA methyltransferase [Phycisphaerales bacterium]|nr:class I SAM-dependent rRNA methyltransferase [Phycisphaerales bacterium]
MQDASIHRILDRAVERRRALIDDERVDAYRVLSGPFEGLPGVFVDRYADLAVLIVYDDEVDPELDPRLLAECIAEHLELRAVYVKRFVKDRSTLGGEFDDHLRDPKPLVGSPAPESLLVRERELAFEIHPYDGFSTGLFLDQRENRRALAKGVTGKRILNTFAYTCGFSVACAKAGAHTTSVDISRRYLGWGQRNFEHNHLDPAEHAFYCRDVFEFIKYAARKGHTYDLIILDPPSFSSGRKGKSFSAVRDYGRLLADAAHLLTTDGRMFCSTNTAHLATGRTFDRIIDEVLPGRWRRLALPEPPIDFSMERNRLACRLLG